MLKELFCEKPVTSEARAFSSSQLQCLVAGGQGGPIKGGVGRTLWGAVAPVRAPIVLVSIKQRGLLQGMPGMDKVSLVDMAMLSVSPPSWPQEVAAATEAASLDRFPIPFSWGGLLCSRHCHLLLVPLGMQQPMWVFLSSPRRMEPSNFLVITEI